MYPFLRAHDTAPRMSVAAWAWLVGFHCVWAASHLSKSCGFRSRTRFVPNCFPKPRAMMSKTPGTPLLRVAWRWMR